MSLKVVPEGKPNTYTFNFNCPTGAWCAIAANLAGNPLMENSTAFVYSNTGARWTFEERTLGNHNSGTVVTPSYPVEITSKGPNVNFVFNVTAVIGPSNLKRICFLFAQGAPGTTTFGYHGSTRGFGCLRLDQLVRK